LQTKRTPPPGRRSIAEMPTFGEAASDNLALVDTEEKRPAHFLSPRLAAATASRALL
jgi:hypothetical protein